MTPAGRAQAAIEILDVVIEAARTGGAAADTLIARYFKERRYAGAKDRRAVRELVYAAIRRAGEVPPNGRAALLGLAQDQPALEQLFDGSAHGPAPIDASEPIAQAGVAPLWLGERLAIPPSERSALLERAPLDLRVNRLRAEVAQVAALFPEAAPGQLAPTCVRLTEGAAVEAHPAFAAGWFEVQDEGSQVISLACHAQPGELVVDLCAGAGGKTLALAAEMANRGRLIACDVDRARLARLTPRAARAGATVETRLLDGGREAAALEDLRGGADVVLVDAPCSGTGTWRRNPEARWRLTPARLDRLKLAQAHVLALGAALARPGGRLVYAVCSLLDEEGREPIEAFLASNAGWQPMLDQVPGGRVHGPGRLLAPANDGTDGFFVAALARRA